MPNKVIVNEILNFTLSATVSSDSTHVRTPERYMLLTVSESRLVRRSDTVLPAALNVLVSSHGTAECYDVVKFR
jgi:hypothetical protein